MSYQVLARKRRPQTFDEVIGQSAITQTLVNAIRLNRLGHAFLFSGSRGIGKTTTARILAKALNCEHGPTPEPCNVCHHCVEITAGSAMDVIEIDGASNRGIDEIRELRENVKYKPVSSRCKVIIIDEVHMLTREAFNALLKTLEEPPDHVKFILATTEAHKVPVTILSRCQRYDFRRIDVATLTGFLLDVCQKESIQVEEKTLEVLARMADGGLRDCLSLLDQIISFSGTTIDHEQTMALLGRIDPELLFDIFRSIATAKGAIALERFAQYIDGGGDETVFNREMMEITRDLMAVKMQAQPRSKLPEDLPDLFSFDQLERMFKIMLDLEQSFRFTEFPRLLMDVSLVKMARIQQLTPLEEILGHLSSLKQHPEMAHFQTQNIKKTTRTPEPASAKRDNFQQKPANTIQKPVLEQLPPAPAKPRSIPQSRLETPSPQMPSPQPPSPGTPSITNISDRPEKPSRREKDPNAAHETLSSDKDEPTSIPPQKHTETAPLNTEKKSLPTRIIVDNKPLKALINALSDKDAPLRSMLAFAAVETFNDNVLDIVFHPDYKMQREMLDGYANRSDLFEDATIKAFGAVREVHYRTGDPSVPLSIKEEDVRMRQQAQEERMEMARKHPVVEKSMRLFRGEIRDIRVKSNKVNPAWLKQSEVNVEDDSDD